MKKKTYIKSETRVVTIASSNLLAGSGGTNPSVTPNDDVTTDKQYSKGNQDNGLWDE